MHAFDVLLMPQREWGIWVHRKKKINTIKFIIKETHCSKVDSAICNPSLWLYPCLCEAWVLNVQSSKTSGNVECPWRCNFSNDGILITGLWCYLLEIVIWVNLLCIYLCQMHKLQHIFRDSSVNQIPSQSIVKGFMISMGKTVSLDWTVNR